MGGTRALASNLARMKPARVCAAVAVAVLSVGAPTTLASGGGIGAPEGGEQPPPSGEPGGGGGMGPPTGFDAGQYRFPLDAPHTYGDGFGAGRGHEGQDLFADCGSPILTARDGRIQRVDYQRRAGHYVVVDGRGTGVDTMYAHMLRRPTLRRGERVATGQQVGQVGSSGNASDCHLHFEIWTAPGWYEGGEPMPSVERLLRSWDEWI
jgi:murein DD-endopeptidase MepM/ murein hydrolase activator NlpD